MKQEVELNNWNGRLSLQVKQEVELNLGGFKKMTTYQHLGIATINYSGIAALSNYY